MKCVILAGGLGTRISEESHLKPKPMVEIGGKPILWHIMKYYSHFGITDFIICLGYKGYVIKEYFANYFLHSSDLTIDLANNTKTYHHSKSEPWTITLVDTGDKSNTGGRIGRIASYLGDDDFCLTYGDGVSDVDIHALLKHHKDNQTEATVTAVRPPGRFGALEFSGSKITKFVEKPLGDGNWINGGFFVFSPKILQHIPNDDIILESQVLTVLAERGQLSAYKHSGFWQPMDTLRDKNHLEELWSKQQAPWKVWM